MVFKRANTLNPSSTEVMKTSSTRLSQQFSEPLFFQIPVLEMIIHKTGSYSAGSPFIVLEFILVLDGPS